MAVTNQTSTNRDMLPWQNGKVERFFGTLKQKLNQWDIYSIESLNQSLHVFRFVRPPWTEEVLEMQEQFQV